MRLHRRPASALILLCVILVFTSCVVREELTVNGDGSGTARLSINLNPILLSYYSDLLTAMTGVPGEYPVFDLDQLAAAFADRPSIELVSVERSALGRVTMDVVFDDVGAISGDLDAAGATGGLDPAEAFRFERDGSRRVLTVKLDRSAVNSFLSFAPPESAMMTEFLFPPADGSVSREEYQDELAWALEEYAPANEVNAVLNESIIEVVITPGGRIESQVGGEIRGNTVVFRVPVLDVLTLNDVQIYRVVFVP